MRRCALTCRAWRSGAVGRPNEETTRRGETETGHAAPGGLEKGYAVETETPTTDTQAETATIGECGPDHVMVYAPMDQHMVLSLEELQTIVQAAYDQHGILATPSYLTEAELAELAEDPERLRDGFDL